MITPLSLQQKARLSLVQGRALEPTAKPEEAAGHWACLLDQAVAGEDPQAQQLAQCTRKAMAFNIREGGTSYRGSCEQRFDPAIRSIAYQQALALLAAGPISSWQSALAGVVLNTAEKLPEIVGQHYTPSVRDNMLDSSLSILKTGDDPSCQFLLSNANSMVHKTRFDTNAAANKKNILLATLGAMRDLSS